MIVIVSALWEIVNKRVYFANFFGFASNLEKFVAVWDFEPSKKDEVALSKVKLSFFYTGTLSRCSRLRNLFSYYGYLLTKTLCYL